MSKSITKNASQILIDVLLENQVSVCWGLPGGAILPFYDYLFRSKLKHILVRHEQAAVHAAEGYAKVSGKIGVCVATSGPGATNLMTGIADAKMDSVPILAITGQVATSAIGTDAFQEVDTFGMSISITKYNSLLKDAKQLQRIAQEAITIATSKRPGPVLIDLPKDVQIQEVQYKEKIKMHIAKHHYEKTKIVGDIDKLVDMINRAQKPLLYIGGGAVSANAYLEIRKLSEKTKTPVVSTLMGLGVFPGNHPHSLGMLGMHGTAYANKAITETDFIIALGARFDDRVAGEPNDFAHQAVRAHVDIDPSELGKRVGVDIYIQGDLKDVLIEIINRVKKVDSRNWLNRVQELKKENPLLFKQDKTSIKPQAFIYKLWEKTKGKAIISTDVGQHQMWAAQYYPFPLPRKWLTSGGLGTMGFGFPAALGAKEAAPTEEVIVISGDGSFQMCLQELATARMYDIKVKIIVFNNGFLGMVRQWQELFYENRFSHSDMNYNPDFVQISKGYDIPAKRIEKYQEMEEGIDFLIKTDDVCLLEVVIPEEEKVYPMIGSGNKYSQMVDYTGEQEKGEFKKIIPN